MMMMMRMSGLILDSVQTYARLDPVPAWARFGLATDFAQSDLEIGFGDPIMDNLVWRASGLEGAGLDACDFGRYNLKNDF